MLMFLELSPGGVLLGNVTILMQTSAFEVTDQYNQGFLVCFYCALFRQMAKGRSLLYLPEICCFGITHDYYLNSFPLPPSLWLEQLGGQDPLQGQGQSRGQGRLDKYALKERETTLCKQRNCPGKVLRGFLHQRGNWTFRCSLLICFYFFF